MGKRIAILGAGYIAKYHCNAIRLTPELELVAICDLNRSRALQLADKFGIERTYQKLDDMLVKEQLDYVHILTPPEHHFKPASLILKAGISILVEKPLCTNSRDCILLKELAADKKQVIGVSNNFLFATPYERLLGDLNKGHLGKLDQVDIVWQKPLSQIIWGPFNSWLLSSAKNFLFEIAPHSLAHAIHLTGGLKLLEVTCSDPIKLPNELLFFKRCEVRGIKEQTHVRLLFSLTDAFMNHYLNIRGCDGFAQVDFERNTYICHKHTHEQSDIDHFNSSTAASFNLTSQGLKTLFDFTLAKGGFKRAPGPFANSIFRAITNFYSSHGETLDTRINADIGICTVQLAEQISSFFPKDVHLRSDSLKSESIEFNCSKPTPKILVTGGTGFIGKALVQRLCKKGFTVRVLARSPEKNKDIFNKAQVQLFEGDMTDFPTVEKALEGVQFVYHLARGEGESWSEYEKFDFKPTKKLARACIEHDIHLIYASSIIVHAPSRRKKIIQDYTLPHHGRSRTNIYARSKSESERFLTQLNRQEGLKLVIIRPGIVIGDGATPLHSGIGNFPFSTSLCSIIGDGRSILPIVLVEDCAEAMVRIIEVETNGADLNGSSFNIIGEPYFNARQYIDYLSEYSGRKIKIIFKSPLRVFLFECLKWTIHKIGRKPDNGFPSLESIKGFAYLSQYDNRQIKERLGWQPTSDIQVVLQKGIEKPVKKYIL